MKQPLLVPDAGPLIVFGIAGLLPTLTQLRGPLLVPTAVLHECLLRPSKPGVREIQDAVAQGFLKEANTETELIKLRSATNLGDGELAVLSLCKTHDYIAVIDEVRARKFAKFMGIKLIGSGGLLLELKRNQLISAVKPILDIWANHDYFISPTMRLSILSIAQEE